MDFACLDPAWDDHFPTLQIFGGVEFADGFAGGHPTMNMSIVPDPHSQIVGNSEVDSCERPVIRPLEFP